MEAAVEDQREIDLKSSRSVLERSTRNTTFIAESIGSSAKARPGWEAPCTRPRRLHTPFFWLKAMARTRPWACARPEVCKRPSFCTWDRACIRPRAESHPLSLGSGTESKGAERKGSAIRWEPVPGSQFARARALPCPGARGAGCRRDAERRAPCRRPDHATGTQFPRMS